MHQVRIILKTVVLYTIPDDSRKIEKQANMKHLRLLTIAMTLLMPLVAMADTYTSLWKQYDAALRKDHPQTALKLLAQISEKAAKERAYGHLLKAQVSAAEYQTQVSPDSLQSAVERLRNSEHEAVASGDHVLAAIYESVLGSVYTENASILDGSIQTGKDYYAKSMAHPEDLAAAYSTGYEPFVVDGVDSKYYYDDMLHVIGMRAGAYRVMHDYYASHGKREGAMLTALELVRQSRRASDGGHVKKSKYIMSLDSLIREYSDLLPCGEVAIERYAYMENAQDVSAEDKMNYINYALMKWGAWQRMNILRNAQKRLTLPSFHASLGGEMALPGITRKVTVMALNNISELRVTATPLDIDGTTELDPMQDKDYATLRRHILATEPVVEDTRHYIGQADYKTLSDTLELKGLRSGMYLVEFSTDNVSIPVERRLLRVCNIYPVIESLPGKRYRIAVLDATSGEAVKGAKVDVVLSRDKNGEDITKTYTCDNNGEVIVAYTANEPVSYRVYTDKERAFPFSSMAGRFYYYNNKAKLTSTVIYTDRRIYRPGQTVHAAAIAYTYDNNEYKGQAEAGRQMTITLRDANRKEVAKQTVTTDAYGMASADFVLPQGGLTGMYTLRSDFGSSTYANFSVEEYKRPTFRVDIENAKSKYAAGDTVRLSATAKTFAGVPVQGARVAVKVVRRPALFWRCMGGDLRHETVFTDTVYTGTDGSFCLKVPVVTPDTYDESPRRYYNFDVTADVTDVSGETRHGEVSLPYSDHPTLLTCDIPEKSLRDSLRTVTFAYVNNAGEPVDADVTYFIDSQRFTGKANTPLKINNEVLTSARHNLLAICGTDTLQTAFTTFTLLDRKAPVETHDWFYQSADRFKDNVTPVFVQIGSSDSIQHVVYTLLAGNKVIEQGRADLKNELSTRAITYKEEWGDGIVLSVAWVKSGHSYSHTARIQRPLPDTRLNMKWTTFRDRLTPGQRETWTLNITRPDGTPAKAQLLATLYDKSLDEIRSHNVNFSLPVNVNVPWLSWKGVYNNKQFVYSEMPVRFLDERDLDFSSFCSFSFQPSYGEVLAYNRVMPERTDSKMLRVMGSANGVSAPYVSAVELSSLKKTGSADTAGTVDGGNGEASTDSSEDGNADASSQIRENLNETAFFYPGLTTDAKGNVSMQFTLPESVTTWQFYGLAHDRDMNNGVISASTVAKKTVMIQPNVPRFVRTTDNGIISARISNTSDRLQSGTARLSLVDPETGKDVYHKDVRFAVKAGETASADFAFDMRKIHSSGLLICRVTAQGHGYSDGEQHYLPVLPDKEMVTNTYAFTQDKAGSVNISLDKLFAVKDNDNKLTVEYTSSPAWLMVQALPSMTNVDGNNAVSLVAALYANTIGRKIVQSTPAIKQTVQLWQKEDTGSRNGGSMQSALQKNENLRQIVLAETPWLADADREEEQKRMLVSYFDESQLDYRIADNISRLQQLQREDGSFAWWKGMNGSPYMTMSVLQTLVRLDNIVGKQKVTQDLQDRAFAFMDRQMASEVKDMKKSEAGKQGKGLRPSQTAVEYLYATALAGRQMKSAVKQNHDYLVKRLAQYGAEYTIYGKATVAVILAKNGYAKEASDILESIRQYTVYRDDMGRYFDTPKAMYSWFDYRIPSQVAAIEALKALRPEDKKTIGEMQRWLLQSKRTQAWDTPVNSVNAVYAFLDGNDGVLDSIASQPATIKVDGQKLRTPKATAGMGYTKATKTGSDFKNLTVEKTTDGTSWGAVYAQFMQPTKDVEDAGTGMTVKREILKDGQLVASGNVRLKVGDRITVRLTVNADRDYDFVQLTDRRAACLEPTSQLSGYGYGYYCQPKDNATNYFFDRMSKGKHTIETTYYIDRKGVYQTGTCTVQCAYAPEFMARTKAITLITENN